MTIQHGPKRPHHSLVLPIILIAVLISVSLAGLYMLNQASPGAQEVASAPLHTIHPKHHHHTIKPRPVGTLVPRPIGVPIPRPIGLRVHK